MIVIRQLDSADLQRLHEIDPSEQITQIYRLVDGQLQPEPHDWTRPRWDATQWQELLATWQETLKPDLWLGAFANEELAGVASLRYELAPGLAQLTLLYVSRPYRRQGVARRLVQEVVDLAEQSGATALYVSAIPSQSAVTFYLRQGFRLADTPNQEMYELEPDDMHMVRPLSPKS